jgi:glutaminyl-peptide cyclotransferase
MKKFRLSSVVLLVLFPIAIGMVSCGEKAEFKLSLNQDVYHLNDSIVVSLENPNAVQIDSVVYFYGEKRMGKSTGNKAFSSVLDGYKLGKYRISAKIYSEGESFTAETPIKLLYNKKPIIYTYKILNTYPHDIEAYTQGLEFYNGFLYESTGQHGKSSLRKVDYKTGKILKKIDLETRYFGEGITVLDDKIHMLTWRGGKGFVFDADTFEKLKTFEYDQSKEGWGLTNDGEVLYKSDGTERIWKLHPETHEEIGYFQTVTHHGITTKLNELEWVEGKIYANTYLKDGVAIINPKNGAITGLIDFRGLREKVAQHRYLDVLNGIAYNPETKTLFVTGKNWDKLFEVEIIKKN